MNEGQDGLVRWARFVQDFDARLLAKESRGEAFHFRPEWDRTEWVVLLLSYLEAFRPDEAVALVFELPPDPLGAERRAEAERRILDLLRKTGRQACPPVLVVEGEAEASEALQAFAVVQRITRREDGSWSLPSAKGRRLVAARSRLGA